LWNGFNGESIANLTHEPEEEVWRFMFSRNGSRLAALTKKDDVHCLTLWNGENGKLIGVAMDIGYSLEISDDASLIVTGVGKDVIQLWSGDSLSLVNTVEIGEIFLWHSRKTSLPMAPMKD
jgi:WD40 repeat protein